MPNPELWVLLGTQSRRAIKRVTKKYGHRYHYNPRIDLLERLADKTGQSVEEVKDKLMEIRAFILKYPQYF